MTTHETALRRSRLCFIASTALFVLFCLLGGQEWQWTGSAWIAKSLQIAGTVSGVFAWSLMCSAYDLRRRAL